MGRTSASTHNIQSLQIRETPVVAVETINGLKNALGQEPSRDIVERAAFEISNRLDRLEFALLNGDLAQTAKLASGIVGISEQIGLLAFAEIARNLVSAIHSNDFVAVASISRRLLRQSQEALFTVVDYADNPIVS